MAGVRCIRCCNNVGVSALNWKLHSGVTPCVQCGWSFWKNDLLPVLVLAEEVFEFWFIGIICSSRP